MYTTTAGAGRVTTPTRKLIKGKKKKKRENVEKSIEKQKEEKTDETRTRSQKGVLN